MPIKIICQWVNKHTQSKKKSKLRSPEEGILLQSSLEVCVPLLNGWKWEVGFTRRQTDRRHSAQPQPEVIVADRITRWKIEKILDHLLRKIQKHRHGTGFCVDSRSQTLEQTEWFNWNPKLSRHECFDRLTDAYTSESCCHVVLLLADWLVS